MRAEVHNWLIKSANRERHGRMSAFGRKWSGMIMSVISDWKWPPKNCLHQSNSLHSFNHWQLKKSPIKLVGVSHGMCAVVCLCRFDCFRFDGPCFGCGACVCRWQGGGRVPCSVWPLTPGRCSWGQRWGHVNESHYTSVCRLVPKKRQWRCEVGVTEKMVLLCPHQKWGKLLCGWGGRRAVVCILALWKLCVVFVGVWASSGLPVASQYLVGNGGPWGCCCGYGQAPLFQPSFQSFENIKWTLPALAATPPWHR